MKMNKINPRTRQIIQDIRSAYVPTEAYERLDSYFGQLLEQRRADMAEGIVSNLRGIVLVGQSGAGKTSAIKELRRRYQNRLVCDDPDGTMELAGLHVPSPASMKHVGTATLQALGYPLSRDRSAPVIWDMVRRQLKLRQTLFLHLDEAQDLAQHQTDKERQAVVNTRKSLMENSQWPVGLLLTGMPGLKVIVNQDPQLARRLYPIEIERLSEYTGQDQVLSLVARYCDRATLEWHEDVRTADFASRLMHAADYEFGLLAQYIVETITDALRSEGGSTVVSKRHFAAVYHMRTAAIPGLNPFIAEDFYHIDPRQCFNDDVKGGC
ncbi:TniB family NTP-binding protein [Leisingera sp. SS27]|uniref:TniB family NTP-binding protein n=1 Tax=Leisingera sp. SS27 TaxID=2979462 RepID=UPI00232DE46F|nr:TniB family NTP-binding protein [Leisingera sp. SS27]MDC0657805.1 TniB family NTP-binding protein [Leisingera sp. SS27]